MDDPKIVLLPRSDIPANFEQMFVVLFGEMTALLAEKQAAYGKGNIADFGELGVLIRANDKIQRLKHLLFEGGTPTADDSIEDSWRDLVGYGAIALAVRRGWWTKEYCPPLLPQRG